MAGTPESSASTALKLDLSRIRHDLRTPINHILGYCELLQEDDGVPAAFQADLKKIHGGGQQLLALIKEYFDEATFEEKRRDLKRLCHELRTPVNHIVGYAELLEEQAEDAGLAHLLPDLRKIADAGHTWLGLMEEYLIPPVQELSSTSGIDTPRVAAPVLLQPGIDFTSPTPLSATPARAAHGHLLVADDDASNREMLARRLQRQGYEVSVASSGLEVLRLLRAQQFDLVLLDMIMPGLDGYQVLTRMKSDPVLADLPVIIISSLDQENSVARCIEAGAEDYVAKPFNSVLLRARIGACLEKKRLRERERQTFEALKRSQESLCGELAEAAAYVRSLLPAPLETGPVRAAWRFHPSTQLGGDAFGYHWLDENHFAVFVLDVCGHGVGAALLSVSVMNVLKNRSVPNVDFTDPGAVLSALNRTFPMERQNNMFFTIWYGVFSKETRDLKFACGGHPPAVLIDPAEPSPTMLRAPGAIIGGFPEAQYVSEKHTLLPGSRLYVFSDGIYELARANGAMVQLDEFVAELGKPSATSKLDDIMVWAVAIRDGMNFEDDVSILEFIVEESTVSAVRQLR
jgi:sigma-B regulation protein RsbU (phosphoserine phosphatase)